MNNKIIGCDNLSSKTYEEINNKILRKKITKDIKADASDEKINDKNEKLFQLLEEDIEQLKEKCNKLNNELNIKQQELEYMIKKEKKASKNILNILDQIDAINRYAVEAKDSNLKNILGITYKKVSNDLNALGIEEIKCKGKVLDPHLHKCVQAIENLTKEREEIVEVIQKGYLINGELLRYASVIIAK